MCTVLIFLLVFSTQTSSLMICKDAKTVTMIQNLLPQHEIDCSQNNPTTPFLGLSASCPITNEEILMLLFSCLCTLLSSERFYLEEYKVNEQ